MSRTNTNKLHDKAFEQAAAKMPSVLSVCVLKLDAKTRQDLKLPPWKIYRRTAPGNRNIERKVACARFTYLCEGKRVVGYIVQPRKKKRYPCIIYARGGLGSEGAITPAYCFAELAEIASWGFIVITSQYPGVEGGEGCDDYGLKALRALLTLKDLLRGYIFADAESIGMYGFSRGGVMAYLALTKIDWLKAAVTVSAPADLVKMKAFRPDFDRYLSKFIGYSLAARRKRSAIYLCNRFSRLTPLLIMCGSNDWRVNCRDSERLAVRLRALKFPYELQVFPNDDHLLSQNFLQARRLARKWLRGHVRNQRPRSKLRTFK